MILNTFSGDDHDGDIVTQKSTSGCIVYLVKSAAINGGQRSKSVL